MKKNVYSFCLFFLALIIIQVHGYSQRNTAQQKIQQLYTQRQQQSKKIFNKAFKTLGAGPCDTIRLYRQSQIDSFPITNPGCTNIVDLIIDGTNASPAISNLNGLQQVAVVRDLFQISHTSITSLSGLTALDSLYNLFWIDHTPTLSSINLSHQVYINNFVLDSMPAITSMSGFSSLLKNNSMGTLLLSNIGVADLSGFENINSVDYLELFSNSNLQSLNGLSSLTSITSGLDFFGNDALTDVSQLSNITSIPHGSLELSYNGNLLNLTGLQNITLVDGGFWVQGTNLANLSQFNSNLVINNTNNDSVRIEYNPQLAVCGTPFICAFLSTSQAATIHDNAPGCNSVAEVQASCSSCTTTTLKTWTGTAGDEAWNNPSNWSPASVPSACDSVVFPAILFGRVMSTGRTSTSFRPDAILPNNVVVHALTVLDNRSIDMGGYSITVNGGLLFSNARILNGKTLMSNGAKKISITNSTITVDSLGLTNYSQDFVFANNTLYGNSGNTSVIISDVSYRINPTILHNNTINGNLSITANGTDASATVGISTLGDDNITGNLSIKNGPVLFEAGVNNTLHLGGNLSVNNNYNNSLALGGIDFNGGGSDVHITQLGSSPVLIGFLYTNKSSGYIILDQDVHITNNAHFTFGIIKSAANKLLVFDNGAGIDQTSSASYVWGPVKKIGNQAFLFPISDNIYSGAFSISAPSSPTDAFIGQYFHQNPGTAGFDTSHHANTLSTVSGKEYWTLNRINGTSNVNVTLVYDSTISQKANSIYALHVSYWNGSQWLDEGANNLTGNSSYATITTQSPMSSFGTFTLGYAPFQMPVITLGNIDTAICQSSKLRIRFSVDTPMISTNHFYVQISDSTGSFTYPTYLGSSNTGVIRSDSFDVTIPYNIPRGNLYKIRLIGTAPADTSVNTKPLTIKGTPQIAATYVGPSPACAFTPTKYYVSQKEPNVTYTWSINGGGTLTANADTAYVTWNSPGNYYFLSLTPGNSCGNGTGEEGTITILYPPPSTPPVLSKTGRWLSVPAPPANQGLSVNWYRNDTLINGVNATNYYASQAGNYTVKYAANCGVGPVSDTISFAANSVPQTITFPAISNKLYSDSAFVLNATSSSGLPVQYTILNGPGKIPGNSFIINGTGSVTIQASQPGNDTYDTAVYVTQTFSIGKANQTITFPAIANRNYSITPITLGATSSSALAVSYSVVSGNATVSGNTLTPTGVGTITVRASQPGDTNYLPAVNVDQSFCINLASINKINGPNSICPNTNATYFVDSVPGATYNWRIAGGSTLSSNTNSVTTTWPAPGNYTLIVSATSGCGAASSNDSLNIIAVTSVAPDSVHNMLPANGAINQQLPLTLSWIPANPNLFYTYDLYLWRSDSSQPATPYVSNLSSVNYSIPINSGLSYNHTYNWMVVAHNGSCTVIHTGPVQQFSLIPLPDLQVYNVNAPANVFSGQTMTITWKVKNNGPGNTQLNQHWTDAIFIAADSVMDFTNPAGQLHFPVIPMLVATKPNVSALNSGDSYSDTATFTVPIDFSGTLYTHVVTNYAPPTNNPVIETTLVNDSAHALPPTTVTLSPTPDLRVDSVVNPSPTFSGSTINLTYKVTNHGATANGSWIDKIYISKDPLFNVNTATLLKFPTPYGTYYPAFDAIIGRNGILQQDSSYTVSVQVVVPNFIYGAYYIYVFTNATSTIYEGANQNNNVGQGNVMQVFLTSTPNLVPVNVAVPSSVSNTQTVNVSWNDKNQGAYDNIEKNKGHYYTKFGTCIPCSTDNQGNVVCASSPVSSFRDSIGFGGSYWLDRVYLSTDSTGLNLANATLLSEIPHGIPNSGWSVTDATQPTTCGYGMSVNIYSAILPNTNYAGGFNYTIPDNLPQGKYYLYVYANPTQTVFEYPGLPQVTRSNAFTVAWSDLTVPSVTSPSTGNSGQPVTISYGLLNTGTGSVYNHYRKDYIYLSNNSSFDNTAVLIDSAVYNSASVIAGVQQNLQKQVKLPNGISGSKYIFLRANADSSFKETNLNNNINSVGTPINISLSPSPDLTVSSISVAGTVYSSTGFPFRYTVSNPGSGLASGNWQDSIFISCNSTFNSANSYFVAVRNEQNYVPTAGSYSDSFTLTVPLTYLINNSGCFTNDTAQVYFFVKTNANNGIYEGVTNNNVLGSPQATLINSLVDLTVTNASSGDSAFVGRNFKVNWTVQNLGLNPNDNSYNNWVDGIYISTDSVFNGNAVFAGDKGESIRLNHNQTYSDSLSPRIPNVPTGSYYLFVNANHNNDIPAERNLSNNANLRRNASNQPLKIYVTNPPAPDLVDTILPAPMNTAVGQPIKIVYKISNNGVGPTYPSYWYDEIWLSNNFQPSGVLLANKYHSGTLNPGQSYTDSLTTTISLDQPQGNYVIVVKTNHDNSLYESDYTNDVAYQYTSIYVPQPVDLIVNNIAIPDTVTLGYSTSVMWNLYNQSNNPANGVETDGIYLSTDSTTNDVNDVLIGTKVNQLNLLPLNSVRDTSQALISSVAEGSYYVKLRTDILNNIIETDKTNNTTVFGHKVYIKVKQLQMNVLTPDTLTSNYLYYKLIVPSSLKGKTISVQLTTPDSLITNNTMYVGLGYLPGAAHFDYSFGKPNFGNQQIVIESVVDSVYYIAAQGSKQNGTYQTITLQATVLPFAILTVNSNHGGNTGNVTVQLKGSLFTTGMQASLHNGSQTINASTVYFTNSATVYATFNLQGAPLGVYDVTLTKPDASVATLASSFTVEKTNNGGLITGSGANTGQTGSGNAPGCDPGATSGLNSQLQTEIVIPPKVFASWPFTILINYTNASNVDIPVQARVLYSLEGAPLALTEAGLSDGKTTLYIEFKGTDGPPNVIRAGSSGTIKVYCKAPTNAFAHERIHFTLQ